MEGLSESRRRAALDAPDPHQSFEGPCIEPVLVGLTRETSDEDCHLALRSASRQRHVGSGRAEVAVVLRYLVVHDELITEYLQCQFPERTTFCVSPKNHRPAFFTGTNSRGAAIWPGAGLENTKTPRTPIAITGTGWRIGPPSPIRPLGTPSRPNGKRLDSTRSQPLSELAERGKPADDLLAEPRTRQRPSGHSGISAGLSQAPCKAVGVRVNKGRGRRPPAVFGYRVLHEFELAIPGPLVDAEVAVERGDARFLMNPGALDQARVGERDGLI